MMFQGKSLIVHVICSKTLTLEHRQSNEDMLKMSPLNRELIVINFFQILFLLRETVLGFVRRGLAKQEPAMPIQFSTYETRMYIVWVVLGLQRHTIMFLRVHPAIGNWIARADRVRSIRYISIVSNGLYPAVSALPAKN
jgi:hypothetical protein